MNPISKEINRFRENFRQFRDDPRFRVLHVVTKMNQMGNISKVLRAEEWQLENRCPFLIFNNELVDKGSPFEDMCYTLREHYNMLRKGFADQNIQLPELNVQLRGDEEPDFTFALHVHEFLRNIRAHLDGLFVCWLPTMIDDNKRWQKTVVKLLSFPFDEAIRFVIADEGDNKLEKELKNGEQLVFTTTFYIDDRTVLDYFKKLMSSDPKSPPPSVPGVMPGAARPDVPPPPRRVGPRQPTEEEIKSLSKSSGVPILSPKEGEELRKLVFDAAVASGENRLHEAIELQRRACELCRSAGVRFEECLMTMVLASYYQQANEIEHAISTYNNAERIALEIQAHPQVTQVRMALGYLYMMQKFYGTAAKIYELASEPALVSGDYMMFIESLRMAGTCYIKTKDRDSAERCWRRALELGKEAEPEQIRLSSFMDVAYALIDLLNRNKLRDQARSIELLVMEVGEKVKGSEQ